MEVPETRYAKTAEGVHLAYQVVGEGPLDLLFIPVGGSSNVELEWEAPLLARFLGRLASFSRLIRFDMRGCGLSDSVNPKEWPTLEQRVGDMLAVLHAVGSQRPALLGGIQGGQMMMFFAATYPERTSALVLAGTFARFAWAPDYPWGITAQEQEDRVLRAEQGWEERVGLLRLTAPSVAEDRAFASWWNRLFRQSAGPGVHVANTRLTFETDLRPLLPTIQAPTLVLCRSGDQQAGPDHARYLAEHIPGAKLVELPGADNLMYVGDTEPLLAEVEVFLTGTRHAPETDRVLATVLFTDIVASTEQASRLGDRQWRALLDEHNSLARRILEKFSGRLVKTTGDGLLATFDGPARAIRCGCAVREEVKQLGLEIRVGLHTGEVELGRDDIGGVAVHIAARVVALAGPGEVLVSRTVTDLVAGSGIEFQDRGEHELKGVPGMWRLYAVVS
jgi:class 3 adenylate cyclase